MSATVESGSPVGLMLGSQVFVVGVDTDLLPFGLAKVYLDARHRGLYMILGQEGGRTAQRAWAQSFHGHLVTDNPPPECVWLDSDGEPDLWTLSDVGG